MNRRVGVAAVVSLLILSACGVEPGAPGNPSRAGEGEVATARAAVAAATAAVATVPEACTSARRDPNTDWKVAREACRKAILDREAALSNNGTEALGQTPEYCATHPLEVSCNDVTWDRANFANVPVWTDADIKAVFKATRDNRFMYGTTSPTVARRCSWLYPDDGCFARAELVSSMAGDSGKVKPYRLFSFGNLAVSTPNSPTGVVHWNWHVVPIVKSASTGEVWVLDAAIEPKHPLPWKTWLLKQVPTLSEVTVTVADSNAYYPTSPISGGANMRATALSQQQGAFGYLDREWERQVALGQNPNLVLGASPPWISFVEKHYLVSTEPFVSIPACQTCRDAALLTERCLADCP